jgi:hypothetical protein
MGNSPITVGIRTRKLEYKAGDTVNGVVYLSVTKNDQKAQAMAEAILLDGTSSWNAH